ncbi:SDR family NAD(P)-dependent oxidoreductase [Rhodococcus globerulus]|uniref:Glucose 1-dehydrogenase n=1 Tax=Rhodococcus globerulus TaxID=33008 RepID=A0ABU4C498_RHOGO|nr:glucose 1-dehydrogenase [Rhodococcus globerulus]MDV6271334.1 glucose 1-dehydrogenase [Rhodococcus globerulus]
MEEELVKRLSGSVAIVTGGGSIGEGFGNGRATCMRLAQEGAKVVVADRTQASADTTVRAIIADGGTAVSAVGDVTSDAECADIVRNAVDRFGQVDILVNNVGIPGKAASVVDVTEEDWSQVMDVNVKSVMLMSKHAIPLMLKLGRGSIVNVSSIASFRQADRAAYAASKGAVNTLTMAMAGMHAKQGIRVNCVAPGQVWTPVVADTFPGGESAVAELRERRRKSSLMKSEGTGWDVANAVLYFANDESRWVTGQTILVDGGLHIGRPPAVD